MRRISITLTAAALLLTGSVLVNSPDQTDLDDKPVKEQEIQDHKLFAIKNVNIIPMTVDNTIVENVTVVIDNKKIVAIIDSVPAGAKIINGKGKWLIPGLMDMHVHTYADVNFKGFKPTQGATIFLDTQGVMALYIANGITTTFDIDARVEHFGQRNEIARGKVIGPRMALAALIDGGEGYGRKANTPSDGRQAVRSAKAEYHAPLHWLESLNFIFSTLNQTL